MRRFLNNRISNYNNVGDKVDDFCEDCENRWLPFSRVWWDSTEKNIANIKRKDNGIFVIKKILSLINSISESIKDIYDKINVIEPPILSEKLIELENDYLEVGVTADDKQEDLNIAIYENYISLKNTKVDKPLIESTSDSLKIVALDNQGESVFIKSNELGKVKSVNSKTGDVVLKTSDLENDSGYTTNLKLNQERDERISGDNLKLDKPTTSGTITTHTNIVGVDDLGNSAKLKATDFGKVKSVNGKEGDVILKTSDLENDSDYTTNAILTAHTSNKANPHNVTKSQIGLGDVDNTSDLNKPISTATQIELNKKINKPTTNNTPDYVLLADGSTAPKTEFGKVDKVMGVAPDASKNVDISDIATNWTHANQRFSGLADRSSDATFNGIMGLDNSGNAAKITQSARLLEATLQGTTAEQALRIGHLLNGGQGSAGAMSVNLISPLFIQNFYNSIEYVVLRGANLYLNSESMGVEILASDKTTIVASIPNSQIQLNSNGTELIFYYNFHNFPLGTYYIKLISGTRIYISTISFGVKEKFDEVNVNSIVWEKTERNDIAISTNNMASSGDFIIATDDVDQNTPLPIISFKSNELFPEGQDFMIDMELTFSNTTWGVSSNASKASIGIGYSVDTNELSYRNVADVKMICFQSIGINIKNDNTTVYYDAGPVTFRFTIVKTGNLIRQTLGSHTTSKTINNNSGYSIFLQMPGFDKSTYIQGRILKLYKF